MKNYAQNKITPLKSVEFISKIDTLSYSLNPDIYPYRRCGHKCSILAYFTLIKYLIFELQLKEEASYHLKNLQKHIRLKELLKNKGFNPLEVSNIAFFLIEVGALKQAENILDLAIKSRNDVTLLSTMAYLKIKKNKLSQALDLLDKSIKINANSKWTHFVYSYYYAVRKNYPKAYASLEKAIRNGLNNLDVILLITRKLPTNYGLKEILDKTKGNIYYDSHPI